MGTPAPKPSPATLDDLLAKPDEEHWEIIDGELVQQAMTRFWHGRSQARVATRIGDPFDRPPGGRRPGGWWIVSDVTIELAPDQIYRPDVLGFRRERMPTPPTEFPVRVRPDWICEVVSPSNPGNDRVKKLNHYHRYGVPHYWILDPHEQTLLVLRWSEPGYITVQAALRGQKLRAEPFQEVELDMDDIFDDGTQAPAEPTEG